jgi:hypothetical protein
MLSPAEAVDHLRDRHPGVRMPPVVRQLQIPHHQTIAVRPPALPQVHTLRHHTPPQVERHAQSRVPQETASQPPLQHADQHKRSRSSPRMPTNCGSPGCWTRLPSKRTPARMLAMTVSSSAYSTHCWRSGWSTPPGPSSMWSTDHCGGCAARSTARGAGATVALRRPGRARGRCRRRSPLSFRR